MENMKPVTKMIMFHVHVDTIHFKATSLVISALKIGTS
jgi:hypothetical protein